MHSDKGNMEGQGAVIYAAVRLNILHLEFEIVRLELPYRFPRYLVTNLVTNSSLNLVINWSPNLSRNLPLNSSPNLVIH